MIAFNQEDLTRWNYNAYDIMYTLEVAQVLENEINKTNSKLKAFHEFQITKVAPALVDIMNQGVKIDLEKKELLKVQLTDLLASTQNTINEIVGEPLNINSPTQLKTLFKDLLKIELKVDKKSKTESCASAYMFQYLNEYPEYKVLLTLILEYRSIGVFLRTFVNAEVDEDGRMRTSYNCAGTKTYRLSSRKNAFGNGCVPIDRAKVLTPDGWKLLAEQPKHIMQYDNLGNLTFVEADYFITDWDGELLSYSGRNFKGEFTPEHRIPTQHHRVVSSRGRHTKIKTALEVKNTKSTSIVVSGIFMPTSLENIDNVWLQKLVMLSADGHKESNSTWRVSVKKQRKKERIKELFSDYWITKDKENYTRFKFKDEGFTKIFPKWLLNLPLSQRQLIIEELSYWDAHRDLSKGKVGSFTYYTTIYENAELIQTLCHLSDYSASLTIDLTNSNEYGNTSTKPLYSLTVSTKITNKCESFRWFMTKYKGEVGCPIVPSGMWLIKYDNEIHITGNCNLANIPSKGKIDLKYSLSALESQQDSSDEDEEFISGDYEGIHKLPNCKEFFIPDEGFKFWNADYSGADAMVVAWDSDCQWLQNFFETSKKKLYIYIAENYFQREVTTDDPWYKKFKQFVHLTNYGGMEEKAAASSGMPTKDAKSIRQWYFKTCPEIPDWHKRLASDVKTKGYVENVFGARGWFLNKDCPTILNQAYAWIPQSTIAILVNKGLVNIWENENKKDIATLLQVHDALAGIYSLEDEEAEKRIIKHMTIELDYKKPLVIPVDFSYSDKSYGDCK